MKGHLRFAGSSSTGRANDLPVSCGNCTASVNAGNLLQGVAAEAARSTLRQALMTWN